ncbi:MAG: GMC family oxidoreductase [Thermodesulfobacteriota bacterium]
MSIRNQKYDFVVIGSGPGGGAFAWKLASKGVKVLVLEAGPRYDPYKDYSLNQNDWELKGFPKSKKFKYEHGISQNLNKKFEYLHSRSVASGRFNNTGKRRYFGYQQVLGVGGTTLHFQGEAHRLNPGFFNTRSKFGYGYDWPIDYEDLEPYYCEAEKVVGVAGPKNLPDRPMSSPYPLPPHKFSYASQYIEKGCKKLGINIFPNSLAILSEYYRNNVPCNYCNGCTWGCPLKDKGSVDVTFIPMAEQTDNCQIISGAYVSRIVFSNYLGNKMVTGVFYHDKNGKEHFVKVKNLAVACGAVQTPRLLLNSEININGLVGKNFMETLFHQVYALHPERLDSYRGVPIDTSIWEWTKPGITPGAYRLSTFTGSAIGPVGYATHYDKGWGEDFEKKVEKHFGHAVGVTGIGEFLPNKDTFITLSDDTKDKFGQPVAKIQSILSERELKILAVIHDKCSQILNASGAEKIVEIYSAYDYFTATHVFGTCLMGDDPETSVVDSNQKFHGFENLYITDASVFPTSGGGESPSLTIEALSLRAADLIITNR